MAWNRACDDNETAWGFAMKKFNPAFLIIAMIFGFVLVNWGANSLTKGIGFDATADKLFTLSPASKTIIKSYKDPIYFDFYFSKTAAAQNPPLRNYAQRVVDLLQSYARKSGGKIIFREHDVEQFTEAEDKAIESGLIAYKDSENIENGIYFGLIAKSAGRQAVIPFFAPELENNIEYSITKIISDFSKTNVPRVGVLTGLPWFFSDGKPQNNIAKNIADNYDTILINNDFSALLQNISVLLIAEPQVLNDTQMAMISNFIAKGGKAIMLLDAASSISADSKIGTISFDPAINKMLAPMGVNISTDIAIDRKGALPVQTNIDGRNIIAPQPLYFNMPKVGDNVIINGLAQGINVASPSFIQNIGGSEYSFTPLFVTSKDAMLINKDLALSSPSPQRLLVEYNPAQEALPIAALLKGKAGQEVVLVGDSDFLNETMYVNDNQKVADNSDFVLNMLEVLCGENGLLSLRAKNATPRTLVMVENIRNNAEQQILLKQTQLGEELKQYQDTLAQSQSSQSTGALFGQKAMPENLKSTQQHLLQTRKELRDLQNKVRHDIDGVKSLLILFCAILFPLGFVVFGILRYIKKVRVWSV